jgi:hypothetical protein
MQPDCGPTAHKVTFLPWGCPHMSCLIPPPSFPLANPSCSPPHQVDTQGNLFNIYMEDNQRRITPVGNISDMKQFKVGLN